MASQGYQAKRYGRKGKGFSRAGGLVQSQIRKASESRGFAVSRLVTHWEEVVGPDLSAMCRPVKVGYGRGGLGATLTVLVRGAAAPLVQQQLPQIRDRVNACYGYKAVSQVRVTQTSAHGFAQAIARDSSGPNAGLRPLPTPTPEASAAIAEVTDDVTDPALRAALQGLGQRILSRPSK